MYQHHPQRTAPSSTAEVLARLTEKDKAETKAQAEAKAKAEALSDVGLSEDLPQQR